MDSVFVWELPNSKQNEVIKANNFIEDLQKNDLIQNNLEITSPYTNYNNDNIPITESLSLNTDNCMEIPTRPTNDKQLILNFITLLLLEFKNTTKKIDAVDLYSNFNIQSILVNEDDKSRSFANILQRLMANDLIEFFNNKKSININSLFIVFDHIHKRLISLIKLQSLIGTIDYNLIRSNLHVPNLSNKYILLLFKLTLNLKFSSDSNKFIKNWFFDLKNKNIALIHFEYYRNTNSIAPVQVSDELGFFQK